MSCHGWALVCQELKKKGGNHAKAQYRNGVLTFARKMAMTSCTAPTYRAQIVPSTLLSSFIEIILILTRRCEGDFYVFQLTEEGAEALRGYENCPGSHI